jgi:hypothetical protein
LTNKRLKEDKIETKSQIISNKKIAIKKYMSNLIDKKI